MSSVFICHLIYEFFLLLPCSVWCANWPVYYHMCILALSCTVSLDDVVRGLFRIMLMILSPTTFVRYDAALEELL